MLRELFARFRQNRKETHEAIFDLEQAAIAEERSVAVLKDVSATGGEKLRLLQEVAEIAREMEQGGDEVLAEAARAYREGLAELIAAPLHFFPADGDARREAMQIPSDGSTDSRPAFGAGLPGGPSPRALFHGMDSPPSVDGGVPSQPDGVPPRRPRGRPKGSRTRPRPLPGDGQGPSTD